jgi:hypothetical protein
MKNNDTIKAYQQKMMDALKANDSEAYVQAVEEMMQEVAKETASRFEMMQDEKDVAVLQSRGIRQLTGEETKYYQALAEAMRDANPKQALTNVKVTMPETVLTSVFEDLQTNHPLLSRIKFMPTGGAVKMLMSTGETQQAQWGELCDEVVKEILAGFKEVDTGLLKLSAFLPVCKALLDLGPAWLDSFVRQVLYEALANGLEYGIINGDGNKKPIGMDRQVGAGVSVTGGVYPQKAAVKVTDLDPVTIGSLLATMAKDEDGKQRVVKDVILIVSPVDYFSKVMPATTVMAPDGTYRNDVLPYPMTVIQSAAMAEGEAIIGIAYKYFAAAGMGKDGRIEYSDHYQFIEDNRVYLIKLYANGFPMDNNAFQRLDISGLKPKTYKVVLTETAE